MKDFFFSFLAFSSASWSVGLKRVFRACENEGLRRKGEGDRKKETNRWERKLEVKEKLERRKGERANAINIKNINNYIITFLGQREKILVSEKSERRKRRRRTFDRSRGRDRVRSRDKSA